MKSKPTIMPGMAWHFDFHGHKNVRVNQDPDVEGFARTLHECGVEEIITFAKGHTGFAYYPTRVGTVHPRMKGDAFGDIVAACKTEGLSVLAYISFGVDGEAGRGHADWIQMRTPGVPDFFSEDWFVNVCPFTPYLDELMLPMIAEVVDSYPMIDGFFFDTMSALRVCHCSACQREFQDTHGLSIPLQSTDAHWGLYGQFRRERGWKMIQRVSGFIEGCKPGLKIGFNHIGTPNTPEAVPEGVTCLTLDFTTSGPQSLQASLCAAFGSTANVPSDVMNTIFNQGWADWSPRPHAILEQTCAAIWARRSRPYLGDRTHPANRLTPISIKAMKHLAEVQDEMAACYPANDSCLRPDILVLHGPGTMYGADYAEFDNGKSGLNPLKGAHRLLLDAGANFSLVAEAYLESHVATVPVAVLPEMRAISPQTDTLLRAFVEGGGNLLIVGNLPLSERGPLDWAGIRRDGKPWQDHIYLPVLNNSTNVESVLVRGDFHHVHTDSAEVIAYSFAPYDCEHGIRFGQGIAPPADAPSDWPALTRRALGAGAIWYLEANIFSDYNDHGNWTQIAWFRDLVAQLVRDPVAKISSDGGGVEVVAHGNGESTWAFLVHHGGEQLTGESGWARTLAPLPSRAVEIMIRDPLGREPGVVSLLGQAIPWELKDGEVTIKLVLDRIWSLVRVDWK